MILKRLFLAAFCAALLSLALRPAAGAMMTSPFEGDVARAVKQAQAISTGETIIDSKARILGGITPHHGLALSMITRFYEQISSTEPRRVWLFSPDHFKRAKNFVVVCGDDWRAADRILEADATAKTGLSGMRVVGSDARLFAEEHGITIHIPLIAQYFPNATIVPMVLKSNIPDIPLLMLKKYMLDVMGKDDVIILSMDLSHYKTPEGMSEEDERTLPVLTNLESLRTDSLDIDARRAASLVLRLFKERGAKRGVLIEHMDTSDILGHRVESGTSYATTVYSVIDKSKPACTP
jgi:AmmeMemoRadiSam system protein B